MRSIGQMRFLKRNVLAGIFFLFVILLTFLPRMLALSRHWAADEDLWMQRSRDFFFALDTKQFEDTFVAYHPGVTTCWLGSLAIWYTAQQNYFKSWFHSDQFMSPDMLARVRFPIAFLTGILILIIGFLLYLLLGRLIAGIGTLFLAIEPFLISESRRAHTDVLTALFLFLALLLWIYSLEVETRKPQRALVLSGICFGLACLTKSHAGAFILFLPMLLAWYHYQCRIQWTKLLLSAVLWFTATLLTVLVVWPYLWTVAFSRVPLFPFLFIGSSVLLLWSWKKLSKVSTSPFTRTELFLLSCALLVISIFALYMVDVVIATMYKAFTRAHGLPMLFWGAIRYNPGPFYFPVMWFVWTGILTLPLLCFTIYRTWQMRLNEKRIFRVTVVLLLFTMFYFIGLSCVAKKISRYFVILLPAISILTAVGAVLLMQLWKRKWPGYLALGVIFFLQAVPILSLHPYYRTYYNPLLSGKWIAENTSSITGAGLDIAAAYLNSKPNAQQLRVRLTWFSKDLAHYFVGEAQKYHNSRTSPPNFDYDIVYLYDKQIQGTPIDPHPDKHNPAKATEDRRKVPRELEHVVRLNGIDYVWIYRVIKPKPTDNTDASSG